MRSYVFMAIVWLAAATYFFTLPLYRPDAPRYTIFDSDWSIGWVLLLIAVWNGLRWWMTRARAAADRDTEKPQDAAP
jgi:uncharacterized membrane protein